jgi:hypothetical protein
MAEGGIRVSRCKRVTVFMLVACLIISGCTSTIPVRLNEPLNNDRVFNYDQVNARLGAVSATIECSDGTRLEVTHVHVAKDTVTFTETQSGVQRVLSPRDVLSITQRDYGAGALSGALAGALAGVVVGAGILIIIGDHSHHSGFGAVVVVLGSIVGCAFVGTGIGAVEGSAMHYQFNQAELQKVPNPDSTKVGAP